MKSEINITIKYER